MFFRILKKDLKRKKTMNIILFAFILLATMFVSSGLSNVAAVMNGTDYFLKKAGVGDYVVIMMGTDTDDPIKDVLNEQEDVKEYRKENVVFGNKSDLTDTKGKALEARNATVYQAIEDSKLKFFDSKNEKITSIEPGHAYATGDFMQKNDLQPGDKIAITYGNVKLSVILDGEAKDALLGSSMMGNNRFLLSKQDEGKLAEDTAEGVQQGKIYYIDLKSGADESKLASAVSGEEGVTFSGTHSMIKMCYLIDMIVAFLMLVLSVCMMLVSFIVLKFSITFTISGEFREIGVLKAIGIKSTNIRGLYMAKYLLLAVAGAIGGFICSIPFSNMMLESVSRNMVLGGGNSYYALEFAGAFIVVAAILLFAFRCTKLVKKLSPIDAIRSGQTGERYNRKSPLRLGKSRGSTSRFLAINDVLSSPRRYATIIITFFICTVLVLLLVNTTSTMRSDTLVTTLASRSNLYYTDLTEMMGSMTADGRDRVENYLRDTEKLLAKNDMPAKVISEVQYKYGVSTGGKDYSIVCLQGIHTKASDYEYTEGLVPQNANEIAITPTIAKMTGAKIGDTVTIDYGTEKRECIVVAYFQSMNQLGAVIRLHEDAPTDFAHISNMAAYQINFTDDPSTSEIENRKEKIKKLFDNEDVMNAAEYCDDSMNCASAMEAVQYLFLGITLIVVVLICVLMERSFISDEKSQIAILKATGFSDKRIIRWHTARFGFVTLIAVLLAAICSVPVTHLVDGPIYSMLGVSKLSYVIDPWKIFLIYPGIVFLMTLAASGLTALHIRGIKSSDISNIEEEKESMAALLSAKDLCKTYVIDKRQNNVLKNVNLEVNEGEMIAIMGPSGSGKSTLLYAISGMDRVTSGQVIFDGKDITELREKELAKLRLDEMGFIFQQMYMMKNLTILDNIILPAAESKKTKESNKEKQMRGEALMRKLGIIEVADNDINEVSGGQLQRACICRSMMNFPKLLFADEPTGALNRTSSNEVMDELVKLNKEGTTIVMVTHDAKVASRCSRVLFIVDGNIKGEYTELSNEADPNRRERGLNNWLMDQGW